MPAKKRTKRNGSGGISSTGSADGAKEI